MGMFTRDAYDEDREARIAQIGKEAYDKEVAEYARKYKEEHPGEFRYTTTEPRVAARDIITDVLVEGTQMYVTKVDEEGDIWGRTVTNIPISDKYQGAEWKWSGPYKVLSSTIGEY